MIGLASLFGRFDVGAGDADREAPAQRFGSREFVIGWRACRRRGSEQCGTHRCGHPSPDQISREPPLHVGEHIRQGLT